MQLANLILNNRDVVPLNPLGGSVVITVAAGGGTVYYADNNQVSATSNQGSINAGSSQTFTSLQYVIASAPGTACTLQLADQDFLSPLNWPYRL